MVSIVIPTYKRPDLLRRAVKSVLLQTYKDFEIIVVNDDLEGFDIVITATGKKKLSKQIWQDCKERKILVNTVDDPQHCDFILPATIKRGDLTVSIGTQGKSPFLTKEIRRWINRMFTPEWSDVVDLHVFLEEPAHVIIADCTHETGFNSKVCKTVNGIGRRPT